MIRIVKVIESQHNYVLVSNNTTGRSNIRDKGYKAINPQNIAVANGDIVEINMPTGPTVLSVFITFLLPLIMFPLGYLAVKSLLPGQKSEFMGFAASLVLVLASMPLLKFIHASPEICRVLGPQKFCQLKNLQKCEHGCNAACDQN